MLPTGSGADTSTTASSREEGMGCDFPKNPFHICLILIVHARVTAHPEDVFGLDAGKIAVK